MKNYYIRKIDLVSSRDYGMVLQVTANRKEKPCSSEQKKLCEAVGFVHCPTFILKYDRERYERLIKWRDQHDPILVNPKNYRIERRNFEYINITKIFYIENCLVRPKKTEGLVSEMMNKLLCLQRQSQKTY